MGKPKGFMEYKRELPRYRKPAERVQDYKEFYKPFPEEKNAGAGSEVYGLWSAFLP